MINLKVLIVFISISILLACSNNKEIEQPPAEILDHQKMVTVLVDIHLTEAAINLNLMKDSSVVIVDSLKYNDLMKKNKIDKVNYEKSMRYYASRPILLDSIYTDVLKELSKMQAKEANN